MPHSFSSGCADTQDQTPNRACEEEQKGMLADVDGAVVIAEYIGLQLSAFIGEDGPPATETAAISGVY